MTPVIHLPRKLPAALCERVKDELHETESQGIIKKVTQPTLWVNSMVNEKRNGDLRICIDPRDLNKAIKREHYQLSTQQEIMGRLVPNTSVNLMPKVDFGSFHSMMKVHT